MRFSAHESRASFVHRNLRSPLNSVSAGEECSAQPPGQSVPDSARARPRRRAPVPLAEMRPARFELATSASAGQARGWTSLARDGGMWLYVTSCAALAMRCASVSGTDFDESGHFLDIMLPRSATHQTPQFLERSRWLPPGDRQVVELVRRSLPSTRSVDSPQQHGSRLRRGVDPAAGLENRYRRFRRSRVQLPPPPLLP